MSTLPSEHLERRPMPWEEFLELSEEIRAEYVDGVALIMTPPKRGHDKLQRRLANALEAALAGRDVAETPGIQVTRTRMRIPDIAVFESFEDVSVTSQVPLLVLEILSPSTRSEDTIRKFEEYRLAGIGQYWIVDRENRTLVALSNGGDQWHVLLELSDTQPTGSVVVEDVEVALDLATLMGN